MMACANVIQTIWDLHAQTHVLLVAVILAIGLGAERVAAAKRR